MTPQARVQAAIEIVDQVIASAREDGPPADAIVSAYFKTRRYAGSKDRRAVREWVFRATRHAAEVPASGRAALLPIASEWFDGSGHGPAAAGDSDLAGGSGGVIALALVAGIVAIGVLAAVNGDDNNGSSPTSP